MMASTIVAETYVTTHPCLSIVLSTLCLSANALILSLLSAREGSGQPLETAVERAVETLERLFEKAFEKVFEELLPKLLLKRLEKVVCNLIEGLKRLV